MSEFTERDVPADVRARITETVHRELAEPARRGLRMPLAVAASVAVLAVAGVVTALSVHDRPEQVPAGPTPLPGPPATSAPAPSPASDAASELDRCWAAVVAKGRQENFPARSKWASVQRQTSPSANVTALRAGGKTFFCMTTKATVTVSDPIAKVAPVTGTTTRVLLVDDNGWVLGTTSGSDVTVDQGDYGVGVETPDGVFLIHLDAMSDLESHLRVQVGDGQKAIPAVPAPAVERTDRPLPAPDRASADGRRLGECLDRAGWPKSYADLWQPLAYVKHGGSYAMLAVSAGQYGLCTDIQGRYRFVPMDTLPTATEPQELLRYGSTIVPGPGGHHMFVAGTVAPAAKAMTVRTSDGDTLAAAVRNGMWVAAIPTGPLASVLVKDANGKTLYDGPPVEVGK